MSLQVWLPLNGDLHNQGLSNINLNYSPTWATSGKIGNQCLNSQIGWFAVPTMDNKKQMSFAYWVKLNSGTTTNWLDPFSWYSTDGVNTRRSRQEMYYYNTQGNTEAMTTGVWYATNGNADKSNSGLTQRKIGQWYHYAFTINYETGITQFFVDGVLWKTTADAGTSYYIRSGNSFLLRESTLDCQINDFRLYDHVLSPKEVEEIAKGLVLHYKLDEPNENLVVNGLGLQGISKGWTSWSTASNRTIEQIDGKTWFHYLSSGDSSKYGGFVFTSATMGISIKPNTQYTVSATWFANEPIQCRFWLHMRSTEGGANISQPLKDINVTTVPQTFSYTFNSGSNASYTINRFALMMGSVRSAVSTDVYFTDVKMEEGDCVTSWCPSSQELGNNIVIVYDSSGYNNNGSKIGELAKSIPSPRYDIATVFNGSSAIKVNDNNWISQGMTELTINLWIKPTITFNKLFSCTESGGWNTESGTSGYLRFPVHVYTNVEQTTTAYKYDSKELQISAIPLNEWSMITFVYDNTGTKTYINGELHHTYSNISYGIHYNMNARLFLGCEANGATAMAPYYTGEQSDFRIYTTVLTPTQIKELYNTSVSIDSSNNVYARELIEI